MKLKFLIILTLAALPILASNNNTIESTDYGFFYCGSSPISQNFKEARVHIRIPLKRVSTLDLNTAESIKEVTLEIAKTSVEYGSPVNSTHTMVQSSIIDFYAGENNPGYFTSKSMIMPKYQTTNSLESIYSSGRLLEGMRSKYDVVFKLASLDQPIIIESADKIGNTIEINILNQSWDNAAIEFSGPAFDSFDKKSFNSSLQCYIALKYEPSFL